MSNPSSFDSLARKYAELSQRYSWGLLLGYVLLTVAAVLLARTLEIRTDFESLLPQGTPSVAALDESRERTGSTDLYTIAVASPDPEANIRLIKDLAPKLEAWEEAEWVQIDQDASFFSDHALLYLPQSDLEKIRDQLADEIKLEKKLANPFFVDPRTKDEIAADNAKRWKMDRWLAPDLALRLGLDQDLFNSIMSPERLGLPDGEEKKEEAPAADGEEKKPLPPHLKKYLIRDDGSVAVLLAKLSQSATDVVKSKELFDRGTAAIGELDLTSYHPEMRAEVVGAYSNFNEVKSISNDSTVATITSSILVLLLLIGFFRNAQSVLLLILPMSMGVTWSVGLTAITYGHLNISTLFVFTMLIGMGIDFGIHYYSRIQEEEEGGADPVDAITQATLHSGRAMLSAALTTIVALLTLLAAHFQGFVEFGVIASYGIALCFLAFIFVLPPTMFVLRSVLSLIGLYNSDGTSKGGESAGWMKIARVVAFVIVCVGIVGVLVSYNIAPLLIAFVLAIPAFVFGLRALFERLGSSDATATGEDSAARDQHAQNVRRVALALMAVGVLGSVFAGLNWDKASFEYNFRNLRAPSTGGSGISYGGAVGRGKSTSPAMILGDDTEQMRQVHETLSKKMLAANGEGYIKSFVTIQTYVPPDQEARMKVIDEIEEMVNDPKIRTKSKKAGSFLKRMKTLSAVEPFTIEQIPDWAKRSITEKDGRVGAIGFLYSTVRKWDALDVQAYQDELGLIKTTTGDVPLASSGFILADVIRTVKEDAFRLMPITFVVILLILLIDLRSIKGALVCLSTMAVALLWTIGGMVLFDIRLGLYNMIVLPMVLGTGIDGSIHIYHRTLEMGTHRILYVLKTTGLSVVAASLTTLAGFAGLLVVLHKGIKSIGDLAVVGILATLLAVISFMPGLLLIVYANHKPGADEPPAADAS
ncbi:MAG: hypothetical protein CMH57_00725 [Myxococcales bacterium]|nr:hypothetical protein [Myxococcales bacterium]